jgi:phosphatidylinositol glycan class B
MTPGTQWTDVCLLAALCAFRSLNTLLCRTFFQPDEYWQTLEVAHQLVFGYGYLTWEWRLEPGPIRSPLVPLFYSLPYWLLDSLRLDHTEALVYFLLFVVPNAESDR